MVEEEEEVCGVGVVGGGVCGVEEVEAEVGVVGGDSRPFRNILQKREVSRMCRVVEPLNAQGIKLSVNWVYFVERWIGTILAPG